jgi:hypothetical protein
MDSRQSFKIAVGVAAALLICSLVAYRLLEPDPSAGYVTLPGFLVGVFVATIIAAAGGNAHDVDLMIVLVLTSLINFFCYLGLTYAVLLLWSKARKD